MGKTNIDYRRCADPAGRDAIPHGGDIDGIALQATVGINAEQSECGTFSQIAMPLSGGDVIDA